MKTRFHKALIDLKESLQKERDLASRCKSALKLILGRADMESSLQAFALKAQEKVKKIESSDLKKSLPSLGTEQLEELYSLGYECYGLGQYSEAADLFLLISTLDPKNEVIYHSLGIAEQERGNYEAAVQAYQLVSVLSPSASAHALLYATECHIMRQEYTQAAATLQRAQEQISPGLQPIDWDRAQQMEAYLRHCEGV